MKIETKTVLETIGVVAVIASLLVVAYELRQANHIASREARTEISNIFFEIRKAAFDSPELLELRVKLTDGSNELSAEEQELALNLAGMYGNAWGAISSAIDSGLLEDGIRESYKGQVRQVFDEYPGITPYVEQLLGGRIAYGDFELWDVVLEEFVN